MGEAKAFDASRRPTPLGLARSRRGIRSTCVRSISRPIYPKSRTSKDFGRRSGGFARAFETPNPCRSRPIALNDSHEQPSIPTSRLTNEHPYYPQVRHRCRVQQNPHLSDGRSPGAVPRPRPVTQRRPSRRTDRANRRRLLPNLPVPNTPTLEPRPLFSPNFSSISIFAPDRLQAGRRFSPNSRTRLPPRLASTGLRLRPSSTRRGLPRSDDRRVSDLHQWST